MRHLEHLPATPEPHISSEKETHTSWESFIDKVLSKFEIKFDQGYPSVTLGIPGTTLRLLVNIGDGCVAVAYGHRTSYGMIPEVELVFDSSSEIGWTLIETRYSNDLWRHFKWSRGVTHEQDDDEQYFNFDEFAEYVLQRLQQEAWLEHARVLDPPQPQEGDPEWLYHRHEPARDSHPVMW
jgi:hypothetical protein